MRKQSRRDYRIFGVPLRTGSLYPGSENDARAYRDVKVLEQLQQAGCRVSDEGDIAIPSFIPHHMIPPIRNWPGPRIVWDCVSDRIQPFLEKADCVPLLIGCDCSVVVASAQALLRRPSSNLHIVYVDGDFDDASPDSSQCRSAAALTTWLLTNPSPFWSGPILRPSQLTIVGASQPSSAKQHGRRVFPLARVRDSGPAQVSREVLDGIPEAADIIVHLDIDVFAEAALPAAYFPHEEGLTLEDGAELMRPILRDSRVRVIEITEYASLRDLNRQSAGRLSDLLVKALTR